MAAPPLPIGRKRTSSWFSANHARARLTAVVVTEAHQTAAPSVEAREEVVEERPFAILAVPPQGIGENVGGLNDRARPAIHEERMSHQLSE